MNRELRDFAEALANNYNDAMETNRRLRDALRANQRGLHKMRRKIDYHRRQADGASADLTSAEQLLGEWLTSFGAAPGYLHSRTSSFLKRNEARRGTRRITAQSTH